MKVMIIKKMKQLVKTINWSTTYAKIEIFYIFKQVRHFFLIYFYRIGLKWFKDLWFVENNHINLWENWYEKLWFY